MNSPKFEIMKFTAPKFILSLAAVIATPLLLNGCGKKQTAPPAPPAAEVSVVTVSSEPVSITTELPGRVNSMRDAQVRARATGILLKRLFEEGANVKEGDILFEIEPAP
jgi:membrane fusion protein (multidrug efflux system)